jgi:hypothetical protein
MPTEKKDERNREKRDCSINSGVDPIDIHKPIMFMLKVLFVLMSISIS